MCFICYFSDSKLYLAIFIKRTAKTIVENKHKTSRHFYDATSCFNVCRKSTEFRIIEISDKTSCYHRDSLFYYFIFGDSLSNKFLTTVYHSALRYAS